MEHELINRYRFNEDTLRRSYAQIMRPVLVIQLLIALVLLSPVVARTTRDYLKRRAEGKAEG